VHRARNLYAKLPESERERVKHACWQALDDAIKERDAKQRLQALVDELNKGGYTAARSAWPTIWTRGSSTCATHSDTAAGGAQQNLLERSLGEVKRRTKVMGRFPGQDSCLRFGLGRPGSPHHSRDQRHQVHRVRPATAQPRQIPRTDHAVREEVTAA
jgi:putative transposase